MPDDEKTINTSIFAPEMKWTVPLLMLLVLTTAFSKGIVWLQYKVNQEFISKNLCINKSRPALKCHGKCRMMKKMEEEEKDNSSVPGPKLKTGFDETAMPSGDNYCLDGKEIKTEFPGFILKAPYISPVFPVFHPPA